MSIHSRPFTMKTITDPQAFTEAMSNRRFETLTGPMSLRSFFRRTGTTLLAFSCGMGLYAAGETKARAVDLSATAIVDSTTMSEADTLQLAYAVLTPGNHRYGGYRAAAMANIREAAKAYGLKLTGDGKGGEDQAVSDQRFFVAQRLLQQLKARLTQPQQQSVLDQVNQALQQLTLGIAARAGLLGN